MAPHKTITVNGRLYDAVTGLPVDASDTTDQTSPAKASPMPKATVTPAAAKVARPSGTPRPDFVKVASKVKAPSVTPKKAEPLAPRSNMAAESVHTGTQRSQTLNRRAAKKPTVSNHPITRRPIVGRKMDVAKSADVSRFAKNPVVAPAPIKPVAPIVKDKPAQSHPLVQRALTRNKAKTPVVTPVAKPSTAKEVKEAAISKALAAPKPKATSRRKENKKRTRRLIIALIIIIGFLIAVATAYRVFPSISVGLASSQAGLAATYPEYTPDGYSLSQPVTYSEGEVTLKFTSNSNDNYYTISQTRSSWDSSAALDNVVTPAAGANYVTTKERGLTIYTFKSEAVWVNGGILYKIDSKAPLSGDQIRKIATSL